MSEAPVGPHRQHSAILFADMHGYSRLMQKDEEGTYRRVVHSIGLIKALIGDYGGHIMNIAGDGIMALFDHPGQALKFAVAIQQEFRNEAVWHPGEEPIAFRIGVNVGDVIIGEFDAHGHCVNIAARLQALAHPGQICVTGDVVRAINDPADLPLRSLGLRVLKNIAEPIEVFAIEAGAPQAPSTDVDLSALAPTLGPIVEQTSEPPAQASVAVLPLDNLSSDVRNDHLCEGITEDIITNLSRFRDLLVIARHSAFLFKGRTLPHRQIAQQLGVRYLLQGSLRRSERRIRIAVQLIAAGTESVIWSERYDGDLTEVFAFQDDVTATIAARLAVQIDFAEQSRALAMTPPDLRAYGLILRGHHLSFRFTKEANAHARRLFEQAAEIDPHYGRSYAAISRTCNLDWRYAWTEAPEASLDRAVELALTAINRDSLDARGYSELGFAYIYKKRHDESLAAYARAIELNPNDADIIAEFADALVYAGQPEKSIELMQKAMRLNPYFPDWYLWYLGDAYNALGRPEDVIATVQKMRNPAEGRRLLAANYAQLGMLPEARAQAAEVLRLHPGFTISSWAERPPYKNRESLERYMDGLRKAGLPEA